MSTSAANVVEFAVRPHFSGSKFNVFEADFDQPLAQFDDMETAEQYALRMAESKVNWKLNVYDQGQVHWRRRITAKTTLCLKLDA